MSTGNEHRERLDELSKNVHKKIETIKKKSSELKNTITEMKNTLEGINSTLDEAEDQTSNRQDKVVANIQLERQKEELKKKHKKTKKMRIV